MAFVHTLVGSFIDPVHFTTLADCQSEQISGGRRGRGDDDAGSDRRPRSGRDCQPGQLASSMGGYGSQPSSGGLMGLNIFQINLAINMIFGGNGNSIFNLQGNQLSAL